MTVHFKFKSIRKGKLPKSDYGSLEFKEVTKPQDYRKAIFQHLKKTFGGRISYTIVKVEN